jgi:hypothetical protein
MMNEPVSKPFDKGFLNSWKEIWMETEKMHMPRECVNCENRKVCTACMAVVKSEGDGKSSPKYLCTMTETYKKLCDEVIGK